MAATLNATLDTVPHANRIAHHFERQLPTSPGERYDIYTETIFQALLTLRSRLTSGDPRQSFEAATALVGLEQTRMRHAAKFAGSAPPPERFQDRIDALPKSLDELCAEEGEDDEDDDDEWEDDDEGDDSDEPETAPAAAKSGSNTSGSRPATPPHHAPVSAKSQSLEPRPPESEGRERSLAVAAIQVVNPNAP